LQIKMIVVGLGGLALGVWIAVVTGLAGSEPAPPTLDYRVRADPDFGFTVVLRADGLKARRPFFRILDGWGLLQEQASHVERLEVRDESGDVIPVSVVSGNGETRWKLGRNPKGALTVRYRVRGYDPEVSPEASFVEARRWVFIGYSVLLIPGGVPAYDPMPIRVHLETATESWASWPGTRDGFAPATLHDVWSGFAAAGDFQCARVASDKTSVSVLTELRMPRLVGTTIANRLFPGLRSMADLFGAAPRGDSLSVLALYRMAPVHGMLSQVSGSSEEGAFLCLATPDRFRDVSGLTVLAAHECLHFYLGGAISSDGEPPFRNSPDLVWLMEGVTEYLTYRLLEQAGSLPRGETDEVSLQKEEEMAKVPEPGLSLADAARRMNESDIYTLVYSRGFLVARMLEATMESREPGSFERTLRDLFEHHNFYETGAMVTPAVVRAAFEARCPGIGVVIDHYAVGANALPEVDVLAHAPIVSAPLPKRAIPKPKAASGAG
jgi:predicted metalloprotease with PDZ domain